VSATQPRRRTRKPKESALRLNLGCGSNRIEGFVGVDYAPSPTVDVMHDLTVCPWPWADNSVDEIHSAHLVEHIPMIDVTYPGFERKIDALCAFMNEVWRILKPGAGITIQYPHHNSDRAWWDPTHRRALPPMTWHYFTKPWRVANQLEQYPIVTDFELLNMQYLGVSPKWAQRSEEVRDDAIKERNNVVDDTSVLLKKPDDA
jgi:predicted SAM-dependent methyltransferase